MDMEEVQKWILPSDYDHTEAEAKHLVIIFVHKKMLLTFVPIIKKSFKI